MKLFDRLKEWMGIRRLLRDLPQDRKPIARNMALHAKWPSCTWWRMRHPTTMCATT